MTRIIITKVIDRIELIKYINSIKQCGLKIAKEIVNTISDGTKLPIDIPDKYLIPLKTACEFTTESKRYNMEKHQFKPFDQVLVRDDEECNWKIGIYSHYEEDHGMTHVCAGSRYQQCIPYNENTAHLLGTNQPYKEPEPKVWKVTCHKDNKILHFTNDEFKYFIENAVINNKDIQWFTTTYEGNNN